MADPTPGELPRAITVLRDIVNRLAPEDHVSVEMARATVNEEPEVAAVIIEFYATARREGAEAMRERAAAAVEETPCFAEGTAEGAAYAEFFTSALKAASKRIRALEIDDG